MKKKTVIGLTGPIAAGKDTVAKILARRGAFVIDADKIGHEVIAPQKKAWRGIMRTFGSKVLNKGGAINRKKLAKIVFSDISALKKLDSITHPEMIREIKRLIGSPKTGIVIINAAILAEMKLIPLVNKVIVVLASEKVRIRRMLRAGKTKEYAATRIKAQMSAAKYRKLADIVITNDGTIKELVRKVSLITTKL